MDIGVVNLLTRSYEKKDWEQPIQRVEKEKIQKYRAACMAQCRLFTPFVCTTDGIIGEEAMGVLNRIAKKLAKKWHSPYSEVCGFVRARMGISIVWATHSCIRGSRVPAHLMSAYRPMWEDGYGFGSL